MAKLTVKTAIPYDVHIDRDLLGRVGSMLTEGNDPIAAGCEKVCIVSDAFTHEAFGSSVEESLLEKGLTVHKTVFPRGEDAKTLGCLERLVEYLASEGFSRSDMLLALGGGTIGDLTGFAAATYLRGIKYVQLPTTLLAAVDSSVGGKTAVNLDAGKNLAGAVWQPSMVIFDQDTLKSLPEEQFFCGMAEVIKSAVIGDATLFEYISRRDEEDDDLFIRECVEASVKVKRSLVEKDERDNGQRQLLNLGHTMGHAIELCSGFKMPHGMAVAIGMRACAKAARALKWSQSDCFAPIDALLRQMGYDLTCPYNSAELAEAALADKKRRGDSITLSVPLNIGECALVKIPVSQLKDFFDLGLNNY